jgi:serine/threonine protein kinase
MASNYIFYATQDRLYNGIVERRPLKKILLSRKEKAPVFTPIVEYCDKPDKTIEGSKSIVRKRFNALFINIEGRLSIIYETIPLTTDEELSCTLFKKDSYLIDDPALLECVMSSLASSLIDRDLSYNFVRFYGVEINGEGKYATQPCCSLFMERLEPVDEEAFTDDLLIQTLHAIYIYQREYKLQHNDLTPNNLLLRKLDEKSTFRGQTLHDADYFRYTVDGVELFLPNRGFVVCISDYGTSSTWKKHTVAEICCHTTGYKRLDGKLGRCLPKGYCEVYDPLVLLNCLSQKKLQTCEFASSLLKDIMGVIHNDRKYFRHFMSEKGEKVGRPRLSQLNLIQTSTSDLLVNKHTERYMTQPPGDVKIVDLG